MWWCWGKGTSVICWRITRPTTTGCARTLRSTRMLRSIDLRRQSGLSHQSLGSAVSIGTTFGWHNRYTQARLRPAFLSATHGPRSKPNLQLRWGECDELNMLNLIALAMTPRPQYDEAL